MTDKHAWYAPYVHPAEAIFAKFLKVAGLQFAYEPRMLPVEWSADGEPLKFFTPDFFLPDVRLRRPGFLFWRRYKGRFIEITTCRRALVTKKHKKLNLARKLYPGYEFLIVYREDIYTVCEELGIDYAMALLPDQVERYEDEFLERTSAEQ